MKYKDCLECNGYNSNCVYSTANSLNYCAWYIVLKKDLRKLQDKNLGFNKEAVLTFGELELKVVSRD